VHGLQAGLAGLGDLQEWIKVIKQVAMIRHVKDGDDTYDAILIWCPGCEITDEDGHKHGGLHMLPVDGDASKHPIWDWNGDLVNVTLNPSILTHMDRGEKFICHSFLRNAQWQFLGDSTHHLSGQTVAMVPLPDWVVRESNAD
jgi:hypothetical protein